MQHIKNIDQRIVLIGGTGFLGQKLAEALAHDGYTNIVVVSRNKADKVIDGAKYIVANYSDSKRMNDVIKENDVVVHLACSSIPAVSELDRAKDIEENIIATVRLLDVCVGKKIRKFIFPSSGGTVYGDHGNEKLTEDSVCAPINAHGVMKLSIEQYIGMYNRQFGLSYVIARLGNVYGRKFNISREQGAIEVFLAKSMLGEPIVIWGDGGVTRDYVYVDDVIDFFILALDEDFKDGVYNVGSGLGTTLNEITELIKEITGGPLSVIYKPERTFDVRHVVLDINKARVEAGWSPRHSISDGIKILHQRNIQKQ